jgi:hypothetical protein
MQSVMNHSFSQAPTAEVPRSNFNRSHGFKCTFDAGNLVPVFWDEVVPGDTVSMNPTLFARLNTPIYPLMDNMFLDIHWFFVPYRQVWANFRKFMGERVDPSDSIDYTVPIVNSDATGYANESIFDYMGLPTKVTNSYEHSALPLRCYQHIYNEWFRDENLIDSVDMATDDGPDLHTDFSLLKRGKRHDYFTSCLPWLQRGEAIEIPIAENIPINVDVSNGASVGVYSTVGTGYVSLDTDGTSGGHVRLDTASAQSASTSLYADMALATATTINELRQAFQIQKLLERDARTGTRYAEIIKSHFGVTFQDITYRPEFLGGSSTPINISSVAQTSSTDATSPQGNLSAFGTATMTDGGFTKSFTEHGVIMGIASARADLTYQQGLGREWSRSTRYDFYFPALAHLGEQSVLNKEIYTQGTAADENVFGYQERWAEMRYRPSRISGKLRSNDAASLDAWHLSQEFGSLPSLNQTFIEETPPMSRVVAVNTEPDFIMDCYFNYQHARPMPIYSVPGLIDHF